MNPVCWLFSCRPDRGGGPMIDRDGVSCLRCAGDLSAHGGTVCSLKTI